MLDVAIDATDEAAELAYLQQCAETVISAAEAIQLSGPTVTLSRESLVHAVVAMLKREREGARSEIETLLGPHGRMIVDGAKKDVQ